MEGEKIEMLEAERAELATILEQCHDGLDRMEMDLHRLQNGGRLTPELIQARWKIIEALGYIKRSGHDGRWKE